MKPFELVRLFVVLAIVPTVYSLIITSVYAGRKKYKTIAFDFLFPPLVFQQPNLLQLAYKGHYTLKRPNFKLDMNIPLTLPVHVHNEFEDMQEDYQSEPLPPPPPPPTPSMMPLDHLPSAPRPMRPQVEYLDNNSDHYPEAQASHVEKYPNYIRNGYNNIQPNKKKVKPGLYEGYDNIDETQDPRPYTGKAQVSSFIDNGQFVTAHSPHSDIRATSDSEQQTRAFGNAFGDQMDGSHSNRKAIPRIEDNMFDDELEEDVDIRRTKTIRHGYDNRPPELQRYYGTFQFTDGIKNSPPDYPRSKWAVVDKWNRYKSLFPSVRF